MSIKLTTDDNVLLINNQYTTPTGSIMCFAGITAPDGWMICDGSSISRTIYAKLFAVINTLYGSENDSTFNIPNLVQRFPIGSGDTYQLGNMGGNSSIILTENQLPSHYHVGTTDITGSHSHSGTSSTNGNHIHNITDPGHTHTQSTINDDFNNSGSNPPGFSADSAGNKIWNNISSSTTGITINPAGEHSHILNIDNSGDHLHSFSTSSVGSNNPIQIINPYISLNYIICYK